MNDDCNCNGKKVAVSFDVPAERDERKPDTSWQSILGLLLIQRGRLERKAVSLRWPVLNRINTEYKAVMAEIAELDNTISYTESRIGWNPFKD